MQSSMIRRPFTAQRPMGAVQARKNLQCCAAMKLYSNPASRGKFIEWYLHELGEQALRDVEVVNMDMREKKEHKSDWFMEIHPFGQLPALVDGDYKVFESGAILLYLADKYGKLPDAKARAAAAQWALFANSTLSMGVFIEANRERQWDQIFGGLNKVLGQHKYIAGDEFSVADVALGGYLLYIPAFFPQLEAKLAPFPNVVAYMARVAERPACKATVAARAAEKKQETVAAAAPKSA